MHSQVVGIVWISVVLLLVAGLAIFLPKKRADVVENSSKEIADTAVLAKLEDSVYHARRQPKRPRQAVVGTAQEPLPEPTPAPVRRQPLSVELNSADTTTLQLLHGIGPAYARRIVKYRERLGGFTNKEQLLEIYGITPQLLEHIGPYIIIDTQAISRMAINTIPLKQLIKHPYIEYYQARDIINLRSHGRRFECADDLRAVPSMADSTLQRLLPYIDFSQGEPVSMP